MLSVGTLAPNFSILNEQNILVSLSDFKGKKLILYFYPKDHTPGCTKEACDFRDAFNSFAEKNICILGISRDSVSRHQSFKNTFSLPFSLLADTDGIMCKAYGVLKEKNMFGKKYLGIERTTILIDEQGRISSIFPKVSVMGHVKKLLTLF